MVTGLNTNVQYRGKVFHVQTEDCERRSLIRTVIFNSGKVVAASDSSYDDLTRSDLHDEEELTRRLGAQHWTLVMRLREGELSLDMEPESHAPIPEAAQGSHPEVKSGLTALDRRLARLRALADKIAEEKTARSESRRRMAERSRQLRVLTPLLALAAIVLVAVGWTVRSLMDGASPQEGAVVAILDSPSPSGNTAAAEEPVVVAEPAALEAAIPELPVETVNAKPVTPSRTAADIRPTEPARPAPPKPPPATEPRIERKPPKPAPKLVEQPTLPVPTPALSVPTPAPEVLPEPEDWTGKLVALADVDVPPRPTQRDLPRYTRRARRKKQEGSVELNLLVNEHGNVAQIRLLKTIPDSDLNEAALEIARFWEFVPARKESYPVRVWNPVTIDFSIGAGVARVLVLEQ